MNNKGQIGVLVMVFVAVIVGIALFVPTMDTVGLMTNKQDVTNQSVATTTAYAGANLVNASFNHTIYTQSVWKQTDCPLESVAIRNGAGTALVANTDYTLYPAVGVFSLLNTTKTVPATALNLTYVDYTHCADGYNKDSSSRTIIALVLIFMALAIALVVFPDLRDKLMFR